MQIIQVMEKRVAIIGAGLSGLLACKYVLEKGFRPIIFEAREQVGGVWNQTIQSTKLQNSKQTFQFSDFPWPPSVTDMFPHNTQVLDYIQSYAQHFALLPYIKFNSKVIAIDYVGDDSPEVMQSWDLWGGGSSMAFASEGKWNIIVQEKTKDLSFTNKEKYTVEFVILCIGRFSDLPNNPEFTQDNGPEVFDGKVLHSMDFAAMDNASATELIKGKKVAIVGSNKSAVDLAFQCADLNGTSNPCTMIVRTPHWMLPSPPYLWGVHFGSICLNRFSELLVHKPGQGFMLAVLAFLLSPLRWLIAKFAESYLRWKLPLKKYNMVPPHSFLQDMSSCHLYSLPGNFYTKVEEGSLILKRSNNFGFTKEGLILNGGESQPLRADVVIMATGYRGDEKLKNIFASSIFQNYITGSPNSVIPLYRQIIHPRIPQLAVIGYSESMNNLHTYEMKCRWLAHFLDQKIQLPTIKEMEKEVVMWEKHIKRYALKNSCRRSCLGAVNIWFYDQLCKDLGYNPRRRKGFLSELFEPYRPADYLELTKSNL